VGPDPAAAAPAVDDTPQDGDYFLEATLADSKQVCVCKLWTYKKC